MMLDVVKTMIMGQQLSSSHHCKKYKSISEILAAAKYAVVEREDYSELRCEQCGSGVSSAALV